VEAAQAATSASALRPRLLLYQSIAEARQQRRLRWRLRRRWRRQVWCERWRRLPRLRQRRWVAEREVACAAASATVTVMTAAASLAVVAPVAAVARARRAGLRMRTPYGPRCAPAAVAELCHCAPCALRCAVHSFKVSTATLTAMLSVCDGCDCRLLHPGSVSSLRPSSWRLTDTAVPWLRVGVLPFAVVDLLGRRGIAIAIYKGIAHGYRHHLQSKTMKSVLLTISMQF
jgi:hypothetical protein